MCWRIWCLHTSLLSVCKLRFMSLWHTVPVIYTAQPEKGETLSPFIHTTMQVRCQSAGFAFPWRLLDWKCLGEQIWVGQLRNDLPYMDTLWHTSRLWQAMHSSPPRFCTSVVVGLQINCSCGAAAAKHSSPEGANELVCWSITRQIRHFTHSIGLWHAVTALEDAAKTSESRSQIHSATLSQM